MFDFPVEKIKPTHAELSGEPRHASIEIFLEPVVLPAEVTRQRDWQDAGFEDALDSTVRLDGINLPSVSLKKLAGKTFDFPINPDEGYIDGSIYFVSAHNPVDVSRISFGELQGDQLAVTFETFWNLEDEGTSFRNFTRTLETVLVLATQEE